MLLVFDGLAGAPKLLNSVCIEKLPFVQEGAQDKPELASRISAWARISTDPDGGSVGPGSADPTSELAHINSGVN